MRGVTKAQALKHPNWTMGAKITIDSATLVNKVLEAIEAYHLFPLQAEQIKIIIHPESIIHAIANYIDGSMLAQISDHNMQIAISYALFYPQRANLSKFNQLDLTKIKSLNFYQPDPTRFKSLELLKTIMNSIDTNSSLIFNMANEVAVEAFLNDKIGFLQITEVIEETLSKVEQKRLTSFEEMLYFMDYSKIKAMEIVKGQNLRF
jgi:1-deoxy-D-xylulose-5-phosphate reductoisomerase